MFLYDLILVVPLISERKCESQTRKLTPKRARIGMTDSTRSFTEAGSTVSLEMVRDFMSASRAIVASERQPTFGSAEQTGRGSKVAILCGGKR